MMNDPRWCAVVVVLVLGMALAARGAGATDPAGAAVEITARQTEPFWIGRRGLHGGLAVVVANRSAKPLRFFHEDSNSVVFESVKDRSLHVVYHACACLKNREAKGQAFAETVPPGGKKALRFFDWSCTGAWPPPPAGAYDVTYRVFLDRPAPQGAKGGQVTPAACQALLGSAAFWTGAASSPPLRVEVKRGKPAPKRPGRR